MLFEYLTKGLTLSILGCLGWHNKIPATLIVLGLMLLGLIVAFVLAARQAALQKIKPRTSWPQYLIYLMLEYPRMIYVGVLAGLLTGVLLITLVFSYWSFLDLSIALAVGVGMGCLLIALRLIPQKLVRRIIIGALVISGTVFLYMYWGKQGWSLGEGTSPITLGVHLLLAVPLLYLLTIAGRTEETEIEIGLVCALLGIALLVLVGPSFQIMAILLPTVIYLGYTHYLLKDMQAFKALLRGMGHAKQGATAEALTSFRRALHFSPQHRLARQELWKVHRQIDLRQVHQDERLLKLIDFDLCLQRARDLLFADAPTAEQIAEAKQLLDLVLVQKPALRPAVFYYRAVAHTHAREYDKAATVLRELLDASQFGPDEQTSRDGILLPAWQLALMQHDELRKRVGDPLLISGQLMTAIAVTEKASRENPDATDVKQLKARLYNDITLADYNREAGDSPTQQASDFDHKYVYEMGVERLDLPTAYRRGVELLAIAVRGQPKHAPAVWKLAADAAMKHDDPALLKQAQNEVKAWTKLLGVKEMSEESKVAYFATVKQMGEQAYHEGRLDDALENLILASEAPQSGADTLRMIAELYEKQGNVVQTMHYNEQCLLYDAKNPQYLERRDRCYISLTPDDINAHREKLGKLIDQSYLLKKSREILDAKNSGVEQYEWAKHLSELLTAIAPERVAGWALIGRCFLRMGQSENGVKALEYAYHLGTQNKPSGDDLEQWYLASRILGDFYLKEQRFAEAMECFKSFSQSTKSGADTHYKLGQCAEGLGQLAQAKKHYHSANMFDHPQKYEVSQALERLGSS
ncbi:MAG: hypothetical protein JNJ77_11840 [Planctomycetia bacterium]|nr:hypothetical protein [Planctomycetia bacterium]